MGGVEIGSLLERLASEVPAGRAIVEVGCWLGAGTAHLALGARKSRAPIHVFDRWRARSAEVRHAARFGVGLTEGQNTLPMVMDSLRPFGVAIRFQRCDIRRARWRGGKIGLYVDDASKAERVWRHSASMFLSRVPVGGIAVLMDFHFRADDPLPQVRYMTERAGRWQMIEDRPGGTTAAVFRRIA